MWHIRGVAPELILGAFVFVFGLIIGSFLNVCILRIPQGKSIVLPPSACPKCGDHIRPYDNIPVVSYLILGGKCRNCKTPISAMYPTVEFLTGVLFAGCFWAFGFTTDTLKWAIFSAIMIVLVFTDLRERMLPDVVNFVGFGIAIVLSLFSRTSDGTALWLTEVFMLHPPPHRLLPLLDALLGAAAGGGLLWIVMELYFRLRHRDGMGFGDVKMMFMVGAFLGARGTLLTIFAGSLLGTLLGMAFMVARNKTRDYELPFGTFLGMAALLVVFFGAHFVNWYQSLMIPR
jgi:leader peptidase (prepilin peptidase) / N-methyltransferase